MLYSSQQLATKTKLSKFMGERGARTPRSSHVPVVVVKSESVDTDEDHQKRLSSPIVISSSEEEGPTPKAKPAKGKNIATSPTKQEFIRPKAILSSESTKPTPQPTPRRKGKEPAAETEEPVVDKAQPLSETTVYLEDM
jgi:hypothetical protein